MTVDDDEDAGELSLSDTFEGFEPLPLELDADGGLRPLPTLELPKIPPASAETFVCLRGPCVHFLRFMSLPDMISPDGVQPQQEHFYCRAIAGQSIDLSTETIARCDDWEPISPATLRRRAHARRRWDRSVDTGSPWWRKLFRSSSEF